MLPDKLAIKQFLGFSPKLKVQSPLPTEYHGSVYGGWTIKKNSLNTYSRVISAGIGNDISFDQSLIEKYGLNILGIDPTPAVANWLHLQQPSKNFIFLPLGLGGEDGETKFFKPKNKKHISHSARPSATGEADFITVPILSMSSLIKQYGFNHVDLLKIDIEGFEYPVISDIVSNDLPIIQLLVEFHHGLYGFSNTDTLQAVSLLNSAGYSIFSISSTGREISFIKE